MSDFAALVEKWIKKHGSEREALKAALADSLLARRKLAHLYDIVEWQDCPNCNGVIAKGWICLNCGHDKSVRE